jgi:hypothetical protein
LIAVAADGATSLALFIVHFVVPGQGDAGIDRRW